MCGGIMILEERLQSNEPQVLTAEEWISTYEPWLMEIYEDPENALREETERAAKQAALVGVSAVLIRGVRAYPIHIWKSLPEA